MCSFKQNSMKQFVIYYYRYNFFAESWACCVGFYQQLQQLNKQKIKKDWYFKRSSFNFMYQKFFLVKCTGTY